MKHSILAIVLLLLLKINSQAEISWTPHLSTVFAEGTSVVSVYFSDTNKKYAVLLNTETNVEAAGGGAKITYNRIKSAVFKIREPIKRVEFPIAPDLTAEYRKYALAYAPKEVSEFSNFEEASSIYQINNWKSYRVSFSYGLYGQRIRHCITFLTLESGQQVILDLSSYEKEFPSALELSEHMIRTWHELENATPGKSLVN